MPIHPAHIKECLAAFDFHRLFVEQLGWSQSPTQKTHATIHKNIATLHHEDLLIFINHPRAQSLWYWVKRDDGKTSTREVIEYSRQRWPNS